MKMQCIGLNEYRGLEIVVLHCADQIRNLTFFLENIAKIKTFKYFKLSKSYVQLQINVRKF